MIPISSNLGGWHRSQENLIKPMVPALSEVEGSLAIGERGDYLLRPAPIPDFADHSLNKAQTLYRPNTIHRKAEHEKNSQHRTASNHGSKPRKHPSDRKIALFKIRIYFSIPVKPPFSIDSKQLIKIQFYSPQNYSFSFLVFQYSSTPPSVAVGPGLTIQKCKTKALPIKRRAFAVRENGTKLYNSGHHTLAVGLAWWAFGMALAIAYVVFVYSKFRGKVDLESALTV